MAKVLEDKVLEVDLNNLTKDDFLEMARYIQHLEEQLDGLKATGEKFAFQIVENDGYLFDDVNGDGVADQVIILNGVTTLVAADIVA